MCRNLDIGAERGYGESLTMKGRACASSHRHPSRARSDRHAGRGSRGGQELSQLQEAQRALPPRRWKKSARDHTSGTPVTNFKRSAKLYRQNKGLDRDGDHIACEKR
jgi:Excalibur calcium-binding domain